MLTNRGEPRRKADDGLRGIVRQHLSHVGQWVSIETGLTEQGVTDLNVHTRSDQREELSSPRGADVWIECKATDGWAVKFRPGQIGWIFTRARYGGRVLIMTRRRSRPKLRENAVDELYVTSGHSVRELAVGGLRAVKHLMSTSGGPERWDWRRVEYLVRRAQ